MRRNDETTVTAVSVIINDSINSTGTPREAANSLSKATDTIPRCIKTYTPDNISAINVKMVISVGVTVSILPKR